MNGVGGRAFDKEGVKSAIQAGKEKYGKYWNENSEKVLKIYHEFLEKVEAGEHPGEIYEDLINKKYRKLRKKIQ